MLFLLRLIRSLILPSATKNLADSPKFSSRILLANDADFGMMTVHQQRIAHGIVLLRFNHEQAAAKGKAMRHLLRHHADKLSGHLTVVSERQIRIRSLQA